MKEEDPDNLSPDNQCKLSNRHMHIADKEEHKNERNKGLSKNFRQKFNRTCRYYRKYMHEHIDCRSQLVQDEAKVIVQSEYRSNNDQNQIHDENQGFMGKYFKYGKIGHKKWTCNNKK